jgi:hypothetical protein
MVNLLVFVRCFQYNKDKWQMLWNDFVIYLC